MDSDNDEYDEEVQNTNNSTNESMLMWYRMIVMCYITIRKHPIMFRNKANTIQQKLVWKDYINQFQDNQKFINRHLRMSLDSFNKLLSYIKKGLIVSEYHPNKPGAVIPELSLFCTLRWLAGCSYLDIYAMTGVSMASFYRVVYKTLELLVDCKEIKVKFPSTDKEFRDLAEDFSEISYQRAITNCI